VTVCIALLRTHPIGQEKSFRSPSGMTAGGRKLSPATRPLLSARDRLILISPFLKLNDRMKELLADKDRLKIDVRIVYGKSELAPVEIE
jgi:hypothetical protein